MTISKVEYSINEEIRVKEVRLIADDGSQLGVVATQEARRQAEAKGFDLVMISPSAVPPVCKIMDFGKFRFEQQKKAKEAKKSQKVVELKEIRLGLNIDIHDFNTKLRHTEKFIKEGDKIKVSIRFRGRELGHPELGLDTMRRFAEAASEFATVEKAAKMEGRNMLMFLAPKKS